MSLLDIFWLAIAGLNATLVLASLREVVTSNFGQLGSAICVGVGIFGTLCALDLAGVLT